MSELKNFIEAGFVPNLVFMFTSAANLGINIWVSFVAGPVMIRHIDRHTFLLVQSKLFPAYFFINGVLSSTQLGVILYSKPFFSGLSEAEHCSACVCGVSLLASILNGCFVGSKATEVFMKKMKMEKEEGCIYPKITTALKENKTYQKLLSSGKKIHIASMLLGMTGTCISFYMIYSISSFYCR